MKIVRYKRVMKWRVIARVSLSRDAGSKVRNQIIEPLLRDCGLKRTKTGTWESDSATPLSAARKLSRVIVEAGGLAQYYDGRSPFLNHLWIYIDKVVERVPVD